MTASSLRRGAEVEHESGAEPTRHSPAEVTCEFTAEVADEWGAELYVILHQVRNSVIAGVLGLEVIDSGVPLSCWCDLPPF